MCKANSHAGVKRIVAKLCWVGTGGTIFPLLAAVDHAAVRGDCDEASRLLGSQARSVTCIWHPQPTPRPRPCSPVSMQPVLRPTRLRAGQIRNVAMRQCRWSQRAAQRRTVRFFAHGLVSDQSEIRSGRDGWIATATPRATIAQKKLPCTTATDDSLDLLHQKYEHLRQQTLGSCPLTWDHGLIVLFSRGMAAWIHFCRIQADTRGESLTVLAPRADRPDQEFIFALAALVAGGLTATVSAYTVHTEVGRG